MARITNTRAYGIGAMSRETGVNIETIRYYEKIGLMPDPGRTSGGNRQYSYDHLKRFSFIRHSRDLGFSIEEIRALLSMVDQKDVSCGDVHRMTIQHLGTVRAKIANLQVLESALQEMASECAKGDVPVCPIIESLFEMDGADPKT
jgi:MerR family mercuric resistance operon transcriptional regulator